MDYDEARHIYSIQGRVIPSVTAILNPTSSVRYYSPGSADRGTEAHKTCAAYAEAMKQGVPVPFPYEKYADSFAMWCFKVRPTWVKIEAIIGDGEGCEIDGLRYAGRLDLLANIDDVLCVVDIKTGKYAEWHRAQIAAYVLAEKATRGCLLYVHADMSYTEEWLTGVALAKGIDWFRTAIHEYYRGLDGEKN